MGASYPAWGARIEITEPTALGAGLDGRILRGMRGLKLPAKAAKGDDYWSRPAWDVRIETMLYFFVSHLTHGMRGLK